VAISETWAYKLDITVSYIETDEVNSKGNPKTRRITHRRMYLDALSTVWGARKYRIVRCFRKGIARYSIAHIPEPKKELWLTLKLVPDPEPTWKRLEVFSEEDFLKWLKSKLGNQADAAKFRLDNDPPMKKAA
jgi:hypothetical protein